MAPILTLFIPASVFGQAPGTATAVRSYTSPSTSLQRQYTPSLAIPSAELGIPDTSLTPVTMADTVWADSVERVYPSAADARSWKYQPSTMPNPAIQNWCAILG